MLCIHLDVPNKPGLIVDYLSASTSHASDSKLDSIIIKPMIVDTSCLNNSCLNNCVMPKPEESGTWGKFVLTCHNCGKIGHIRPNYYLLKSHKPWIKQDAMRKSEVDDSFSWKYVICKNANYNSAENVKKHSSKRSLSTCHHCSITGHIRLKCPQLQAQKPKKLPTRATLGSTLPPKALQAPLHQQKFVSTNQSGKKKKKTNQGATRESHRSPMVAMTMKDCWA
jgi:hypothetical protein